MISIGQTYKKDNITSYIVNSGFNDNKDIIEINESDNQIRMDIYSEFYRICISFIYENNMLKSARNNTANIDFMKITESEGTTIISIDYLVVGFLYFDKFQELMQSNEYLKIQNLLLGIQPNPCNSRLNIINDGSNKTYSYDINSSGKVYNYSEYYDSDKEIISYSNHTDEFYIKTTLYNDNSITTILKTYKGDESTYIYSDDYVEIRRLINEIENMIKPIRVEKCEYKFINGKKLITNRTVNED